MKVIDASVAIKWFVPEEIGAEEAYAVLDKGGVMAAPDIVVIEVLSALTRRFREKKTTIAEAQRHCKEWLSIVAERDIALFSHLDLIESGLTLSFNLHHALADCCYLALARKLDAELITADVTLHKRAQSAQIQSLLIGKLH